RSDGSKHTPRRASSPGHMWSNCVNRYDSSSSSSSGVPPMVASTSSRVIPTWTLENVAPARPGAGRPGAARAEHDGRGDGQQRQPGAPDREPEGEPLLAGRVSGRFVRSEGVPASLEIPVVRV